MMTCDQAATLDNPDHPCETDPAPDLATSGDDTTYRDLSLPPNRGTYAEISLAAILHDPAQPRAGFDPSETARLARSFRSHGQLQPIVVRRAGLAGRYVLVSGERRVRAAGLAQMGKIAALVLDGEPGPADTLEMQLVEDAHRVGLKPIEQGRAFRRLMNHRGWNASQLAESLNLHRGTVSRALALLDLPAMVRDQVESGALSARAALRPCRDAVPDTREASEPPLGSTRVFRTAAGWVTVALDAPGGLDQVVNAVLEVAQTLQGELRARQAAAIEPPQRAPEPIPSVPDENVDKSAYVCDREVASLSPLAPCGRGAGGEGFCGTDDSLETPYPDPLSREEQGGPDSLSPLAPCGRGAGGEGFCGTDDGPETPYPDPLSREERGGPEEKIGDLSQESHTPSEPTPVVASSDAADPQPWTPPRPEPGDHVPTSVMVRRLVDGGAPGAFFRSVLDVHALESRSGARNPDALLSALPAVGAEPGGA